MVTMCGDLNCQDKMLWTLRTTHTRSCEIYVRVNFDSIVLFLCTLWRFLIDPRSLYVCTRKLVSYPLVFAMKAHVCSTSSALYVIVCYLSMPIKVQFVKHTTGSLHNIRQRKSYVSFCPCYVLLVWLEPFTGVSVTSWCYICYLLILA